MNLFATKRQKEIVSKKELLGIFALFTFLLVMFFPKDKIVSLVAQEVSNYDLSTKYLINIIHSYPKDNQPKIILVNMYLKMQRFDDASKLLKTFSEDSHYVNRIDHLKYAIAKAHYFEDESAVDKSALSFEMENILYSMIPHAKGVEDFEFIRTQAQRMNFQKLKVMVEIEMIKQNLLNVSEVFKIYKVALYLKMDKQANTILQYELRHSSDPQWRLLLAQKEFTNKNYVASVKNFEFAFTHAKTQNEKVKSFKELINFHMALQHKDDIVTLIEKNESLIMNNDELVKMVISYYLGNDMLADARRFSLKLFQYHHKPLGE
ncbi:MAG: hypothetical protein Q8M39_01635 [Sulfuricurvum sp.]|nr:hypothetical protein [Sulfuricurvum sp.]